MIMIVLAFISAVFRIAVVGFAIVLITRLNHILTWRERTGAGVIGGSGFLTIAVILDVGREGTPFDTVAGLMLSLGLALFFWGFMDRKLGHERRNAEARGQAAHYLNERGRL